MLGQPPIPRRVAIAGWRPAARRMGDLVTVNPNVNVSAPISIDLGNLPLSLGLFAGSTVVFVLKNELPKGAWRTGALIGAIGLAGFGVYNLFSKKQPAGQPANQTPPAQATPATDVNGNPVTSQVVNIPTNRGFESISGRIISPTDFSTIDRWFWQKTYPVQIRLSNSSGEQVQFTLELTGQESPAPIGEDAVSPYALDVTLGPGETRDVDVDMPTATWGWNVTYVDVVLTAKKRRTAGDQPVMLDFKSFVIS